MVAADEMADLTPYNDPNIVAPYLPSSFSYTICTEQPSGGSTSPTHYYGAEIINEMNNHYVLFGLFCHGAPISAVTMSTGNEGAPRWCVNAVDNVANGEEESGNGLDKLTNVKFPSILYTIGCEHTPFDYDDPNGFFPCKNMLESYTYISKGGGPAFLGNTRLGLSPSSSYIFKNFVSLTSSGVSYLHLGVSEAISKNNYGYHYLTYSHNLIGDPETEICTNTPSQFLVLL